MEEYSTHEWWTVVGRSVSQRDRLRCVSTVYTRERYTTHWRNRETWKSVVIRARERERDAASPVVIPFTDWNLRPFVTVKEVAIASLSVFFLRSYAAHRSRPIIISTREATLNDQSTRPILISYRFSSDRKALRRSVDTANPRPICKPIIGAVLLAPQIMRIL